MRRHSPDPTAETPPRCRCRSCGGQAVSPGSRSARSWSSTRAGFGCRRARSSADAVAAELERLDRGLEAARAAADADETEARTRLGPQYADILAAHCRMIADPTLAPRRPTAHRERTSLRRARRRSRCSKSYVSGSNGSSGSHLSARAADVRDIEARILSQLIGEHPSSFQDELAAPAILLAHDLTPERSGRARPASSFWVSPPRPADAPAIRRSSRPPSRFPPWSGSASSSTGPSYCRMAIIDGDEGLVILDPDAETQERYHKLAAERSARFQVLTRQADLPAETLDGKRVELWGNIEFGGEVEACLESRRRRRRVCSGPNSCS